MRRLLLASLALAACGTGPVDPAEFINMRIEEVTGVRAVIRSDTSVPASCLVEYGPTMALGMTATDPDMEPGELGIKHNVPLEDLASGQTYFIRAQATNADNEITFSEMLQFSTLFDGGSDPTTGMKNVALLTNGATIAAVSSNWSHAGNQSSYGINNAFDGAMTSEWSTAYDGDDAAVTIDFGQPKTLHYFAYRSRMMTDGTSIVTRVRLLIGPDFTTTLGPYETPDHTVRYVFGLEPPITAQEIRFEAVATTGGNTGAREIQFFER
jgi:hypothetical protein